MPTIYYFPQGRHNPAFVSYLGGYIYTEVHIISHWIVPGTLDLDG